MMPAAIRRMGKAIGNASNLLHGYNLYVNRAKLRLIERTFCEFSPGASSFADLGGVWRVNAAYTRHALKQPGVRKGILVDTDVPEGLKEKLRRRPALEIIEADFAAPAAVSAIGHVDVAIFFDVLLHQANPDWNEVLAAYSRIADCLVIYNQQYVRGTEPIRLTNLSLEAYVELASGVRYDFYKYVFEHKTEIHPRYGKPWGDIHNLTQWGITDHALREVMTGLGYRETFYHNFGMFLNLPAFENHAFIFCRG